jgi:hypothetical protein
MDNLLNTRENRRRFLHTISWAALVGGVLLIFAVAPFLLGKYCGHGSGLFVAIVDLSGWIWLEKKYFGKQRLAFSTRVIWFLGLAYVLFAVVFQAAHFLSLNSPRP